MSGAATTGDQPAQETTPVSQEVHPSTFVSVQDPDGQFTIEPPLSGWKIREKSEVPLISEVRFDPESHFRFIDIAKFLIEERGVLPEEAGLVLRTALTGGWASEAPMRRAYEGLPIGLLAEALTVRLSGYTSDQCAAFYFGMETERCDELRSNFARAVEAQGRTEFGVDAWTQLQARVAPERPPRSLSVIGDPQNLATLTRIESRIVGDIRGEVFSSLGLSFLCDTDARHSWRGMEFFRQCRAGIPNCGADIDAIYE